MQYGLRIIFETQLSHKTKRGQMTNDRRQMSGFLKVDFGMQKVEGDIKHKAFRSGAQGKKMTLSFCCLEP